MRTIWKFPLVTKDGLKAEVEMPAFSQILDVRSQAGILCLWARVDTDQPTPNEVRTFRVYGTGHEIDRNIPQEYVGSDHGYSIPGVPLVLHIFEELKR